MEVHSFMVSVGYIIYQFKLQECIAFLKTLTLFQSPQSVKMNNPAIDQHPIQGGIYARETGKLAICYFQNMDLICNISLIRADLDLKFVSQRLHCGQYILIPLTIKPAIFSKNIVYFQN